MVVLTVFVKLNQVTSSFRLNVQPVCVLMDFIEFSSNYLILFNSTLKYIKYLLLKNKQIMFVKLAK